MSRRAPWTSRRPLSPGETLRGTYKTQQKEGVPLVTTPSSLTLIRIFGKKLELLSSTLATVGIPSTSLDFLGCTMEIATYLLASTNGLLCVYYSYYRSVGPQPPPTFIANRTTRLAQRIPGTMGYVTMGRGNTLGLAFDPSVDAHKFCIVQSVRSVIAGTIKFRFVVFSSDTSRWMAPNTRVTMKKHAGSWGKESYAAGVLNFDYEGFILWFDAATSATGAVNMPWSSSRPQVNRRRCTEASGDGQQLLCMNSDSDALTVYHLVKTETSILHWDDS